MYDVIIIGAGPAGMTAGLYCIRTELKTLVIESQMPGGQIATAEKIDNYPGFPNGITGMELAVKIEEQAKNAGVTINTLESVENIKKMKEEFLVLTSEGEYKSRSIIISSGLRNRRLNIPGEDEFFGRGVSYCATCDGPLFKDKRVAIIGSGTGAVKAALFMEGIASEVSIILNGEKVKVAEPIIGTRLDRSNISLLKRTKVGEIIGDQVVNGLRVMDLMNKNEYEIKVDGVFIEVGKDPNTAFLSGLGLEMDERGYIAVDSQQRTNIKGFFAAGDVTSEGIKQVTITVAHGCKAALSAYEYLKGES
ncbi:MAG: thioredoxin-disulfide reductase [Halobacteriota archaeon]|nr:thioredoxin-disulfide reductase [Halobacteriota archaeon]